MWGPLTPEIGLTCFDYASGASKEAIRTQVQLTPKPIIETEAARLERFVDSTVSDCFRVDRLTVNGAYEFAHETPYHIGIVTAGRGEIETRGSTAPLVRGDSYFASHKVRRLRIRAQDGRLCVYLIA